MHYWFFDQVTFVVTHFSDPRISSADIKDLLLQSISVLVQYKEYLVSFETNHAATHKMPKALFSAFDNRSWIPVTNILLRLCKGSGFGSSKHGETSSSSVVFQVKVKPCPFFFFYILRPHYAHSDWPIFFMVHVQLMKRLLRDVCAEDEELFAAFLNRLFNTLSWTMTEFSVSIREMQEKNHVSLIFIMMWLCKSIICVVNFLYFIWQLQFIYFVCSAFFRCWTIWAGYLISLTFLFACVKINKKPL